MIELKPETERLVREEIQRGHFGSVDEIILQGVSSWREKHSGEATGAKPRRRLYDLLTQPPFSGSGLEIEHQNDLPRDIDLG